MKPNLKHQCAEMIRHRVLRLELRPGELLDEAALSAEFGISRTPLREIIHRLCGEGYLLSQDNRGAKVASLDLSTLRHFFQSAPMIYASIARLAVENSTPEQLQTLRQIQQEFKSAVAERDSAAAAMNNHRFHAQLGTMAASPYLMPSLNRLLIDHTRIGQMFYQSTTKADRSRIETAVAHHDAMIEAIETNNMPEIVDLTLNHWELSRNRMEQFVKPDPLPFDFGDPSKEQSHAV